MNFFSRWCTLVSECTNFWTRRRIEGDAEPQIHCLRRPKLYSRVTKRRHKAVSSKGDTIELQRQLPLELEMLNIYNKAQETGVDPFPRACCQAAIECRNFARRVKYITWSLNFSHFMVASSATVLTQLNASVYAGAGVTFFGAIVISLQSMGEWEQLVEKYLELSCDFIKLSTSTQPNRQSEYLKLAYQYENAVLSSDLDPYEI